MSVTIELAPDVEARARKRAAQRGQDLSGYLAILVRQDVVMREPPELALDVALQSLIAEAQALEAQPPSSPMEDSFGQGLREKYRRQGFDL